MLRYEDKIRLQELRRRIDTLRPMLPRNRLARNASAPDNADVLLRCGQFVEIADVLDDSGNVKFSLGTTGLTDEVYVE